MSLSIDTLSDTEAQRLLVRFLEGNLDAVPAAPSADAVQALLDGAAEPRSPAGGGAPTPVQPATDGELARDALRLLAEDPETARRLEQLQALPEARSFVDPATFVLTSALALAVLQLSGVVSYDEKNGFKLRLEKRAASETLLGSFIAKVLARFGGG